jgi:hypothetical protein
MTVNCMHSHSALFYTLYIAPMQRERKRALSRATRLPRD